MIANKNYSVWCCSLGKTHAGVVQVVGETDRHSARFTAPTPQTIIYYKLYWLLHFAVRGRDQDCVQVKGRLQTFYSLLPPERLLHSPHFIYSPEWVLTEYSGTGLKVNQRIVYLVCEGRSGGSRIVRTPSSGSSILYERGFKKVIYGLCSCI